MDYYRILNVSKKASQTDIKKAYRKLSGKYHPDNAGEQHRDMFEQVQKAYDVLGDKEKRAEYDRELEHPEGGPIPAAKPRENAYGDMSSFFSGKYQDSFEQFFGPGPKAKQTKQDKTAPVNTDKIFNSFFKVK